MTDNSTETDDDLQTIINVANVLANRNELELAEKLEEAAFSLGKRLDE